MNMKQIFGIKSKTKTTNYDAHPFAKELQSKNLNFKELSKLFMKHNKITLAWNLGFGVFAAGTIAYGIMTAGSFLLNDPTMLNIAPFGEMSAKTFYLIITLLLGAGAACFKKVANVENARKSIVQNALIKSL